MLLLKKNVFTSITFCIAACTSVQALVSVEQILEFFVQHAPQEYIKSNQFVYSDDIAAIFETIQSNNTLDEMETTAFDIAVQVQKGEWIDTVLNYSNSPNIRSIRSFQQALDQAIEEKHIIPIRSPKWTPQIINQPLNSAGDTGIILAARAQNQALINQLQEFGAHAEKKNIAGENALSFISE